MTTDQTPTAVSTIAQQYKAGIAHAFILTGNIHDYITPGTRLADYLKAWLAGQGMTTQVTYNRAQGLQFPTMSSEKTFRALVSGQQAQPATNPALAALQAARGGQAAPQAEQAPLPTSPEACLALIDKALRNAEPQSLAVIINWAETIAPSSDPATMSPSDRTALVTLAGWAQDSDLAAKGNMVFLTTDSVSDLAGLLRLGTSAWSQVVVDYPSTAERLAFIEWYTEARPDIALEITPTEFSALSAGLNCMMIEDIFLRGALAGSVTAEFISTRKAEIIKAEYGDILEVMSTQGLGYQSVGGMDYIKAYFTKSVITPMRQGNTRRPPMGVLMMGPAGTGKSIMAQAVAAEAGINCIKLNIGGQIASKWQGEGERNLSRALAAVSNFAPTIVFIDEIDQVVSRGSGDNQQDSRIFQMLMEYMSDTSHRGKVVFLAATNRPDLMDSALRRPGRFDDKLAFLVPQAAERESIFQVMARKYGLSLAQVPSQVVEITAGYTGAEIEAITRKAANLALDEGITGEQALSQAAAKIRPTTQDIEFMTALALAEISDLDLLPPGYQERAQDKAALAQQIEALAPSTRKGR